MAGDIHRRFTSASHGFLTIASGMTRSKAVRGWALRWVGSSVLVLSALIPSVLLAPAASQNLSVKEVAEAVDAHYNHLRSLQAEFIEVYRGTGMDREESGTLWLKKPRKMRWEYRSPKAKLFVSDGKTVWFYLPAERQVRQTDLKKLDDLRSPIAFLLGKTKLENELRGLSFVVERPPATAGNRVLRGVPQNMADRVNEVELEINPANQIVRMAMTEVDGATTEFRLSNVKENVELGEERFRFVPPAGVESSSQ
jgi:outer membrane lipoprotein carrier protein